MNIKESKYRFRAILLSVIYLSFFIISTFLHQHPSKSSIVTVSGETICYDSQSNCCQNNENQHLDDSHHEHFDEVCIINNVFSLRSSNDSENLIPYSEMNYFVKDVNSKKIIAHNEDIVPHFNWSKLVHSATNVSPPLV